VDVVLRHDERTYARTIPMSEVLEYLVTDQGVAVTLGEALALLRVGMRDDAQIRDECGVTWVPSKVFVEVNDDDDARGSLIVETRDIDHRANISFRFSAGAPRPLGAVASGNGDAHHSRLLALTRDAAVRASLAASRRERVGVEALRAGAEALRAVSAALDACRGGDGRGDGRGDGETDRSAIPFGSGRSGGLDGNAPSATRGTLALETCSRFRRLAEAGRRASGRMESLVAGFEKRTAGERMGEDEMPLGVGVAIVSGERDDDDAQGAEGRGEAASRSEPNAPGGNFEATFERRGKRRRVGGWVGLKLRGRVDAESKGGSAR
jgi:hypothetical protein